MNKKVFHLVHQPARNGASEFAQTCPEGWRATFEPKPRTLSQNARQWPYLQGFAQQLMWPVNGQMVKMDEYEWKDVLTAAYFGEAVRLAQGLNGGVVMLGKRTSKFSEPVFNEWMAFLKATAADRGVTPVYANNIRVSDSE